MRTMQSQFLAKVLGPIPEDEREQWLNGFKAACALLRVGDGAGDGARQAIFLRGSLEVFLDEEAEQAVREQDETSDK